MECKAIVCRTLLQFRGVAPASVSAIIRRIVGPRLTVATFVWSYHPSAEMSGNHKCRGAHDTRSTAPSDCTLSDRVDVRASGPRAMGNLAHLARRQTTQDMGNSTARSGVPGSLLVGRSRYRRT